MDIGPTELIIALVIILLLFGGKKLPEIARGLGRAQHEFKEGMQNPDGAPSPASTTSTTPIVPSTTSIAPSTTPVAESTTPLAPSTPATASTAPPGE